MKLLFVFLNLLLFITPTFSQTAKEFEQLAIQKMKADDYVYALGLIDKAIELDAEKGSYYITKSFILNHLRRFDDVEKNILKATEVEPENLIVLMQAGEYYRIQSNLDSSIRYYQQALKFHPEEELAIKVEMANAYRYLRQFDKAKALLDEVLEKDNQHLGALTVYTIIYSFTKEEEKALEMSLRVLEIDPENEMSLMNAGYYLTALNRPEESLPYFDKSIALDPENSYVYNNRGFALYQLGRYREALKDIEKSIHLYDSNSFAYKNLGLTYLAMGKKEDACKALFFAKQYGFTENFGPEVDELIKENCQ